MCAREHMIPGRVTMLAKITKRNVDALRPGKYIADPEVRGLVARCLPSGSVSYGFRYRNPAGRQLWLPLGLHGQITPDQARDLAKKRAGEVADKRDPVAERSATNAAAAKTVNFVLDEFLKRYVYNPESPLRSADQYRDTFRRYVRPHIGNISIYALMHDREAISAMLDAIEDNSGATSADRALAYLRSAFVWHEARDSKFRSPIVKGMARTEPSKRARIRFLNDQEIRDLWAALDELDGAPACYPSFVRVLLLTGQRRQEVARMRWEEIEKDVWTIPAERSKTGAKNAVPLTAQVKALLGPAQKAGFVFSSNGGRTAFGGYSKPKAALDVALAELRKRQKRSPMPQWQQHDLRRTARSLMSRAGVLSDHAERVIGHAIPGIRGVYDRHAYLDEKRLALERLAALVDRILRPGEAVVQFPKKGRRTSAS
jgi:integrase